MEESAVLIYGTNMGGYRCAYALCKKGYKVFLLNPGCYVDEKKNQLLAQLPLDFCWICGHMPQRLFKALGCLQDFYNAEILEIKGKAGNFTVRFKKRDQIVNNFICTECDRCIEVCPEERDGKKAIYVIPHVAWENIYLIDKEICTKCGKCEEVCPTGAIKIERAEEEMEVKVNAIVLALEYEIPDEEDLKKFGFGKTERIKRNRDIAENSLLTNFVQDSLELSSGEIPKQYAIVITPHFNTPGIEYENPNLSITAIYRALKIKEILPEAKVKIFLKDYKGTGYNHYRWYKKAKDLQVEILRVDDFKSDGDKNRVVIEYEKDGKRFIEETEMLILVTGQKPPSEMAKMEKLLGLKKDEMGFPEIGSFTCAETNVPGVFAVGEFSGPKSNPETVWQGLSAFTEILKYLGKKSFSPPQPPPLRDVSGETPEIGVFICSCFGKFNEKMDLDALKKRVQKIPHVKHVEIIDSCCTPSKIKETSEKIKKAGVNRVVIAACTPLQKLLKYRKAVMTAGLNPLLSEYLRLREDVINVHSDKERMLEKAEILIKSGIEQVKKARQAPTPQDDFENSVLIIGGGISGIIAAKEISDNGFQVTIVERKKDIGGMLEYLDEEEKEFVKKLMDYVKKKENIKIYTQNEIKAVHGYAGNFRVELEKGETLKVGIIMIATGAKEYKPKGFLYGEDERVLTQNELKLRLSKEKFSGKVAMIQCIGSRNGENPFCSRICCEQALKNALILKEKGCDVDIYYRDIVLYGKSQKIYEEAKRKGIKFIRFEEKRYPEVKKEKGKLVVEDQRGKKKYDFVILSTGIIPDRENNKNLSKILNYPLNHDGFFDNDVSGYPFEEAIKRLLKPFELATNGIFPIGLAHSPRNFKETLIITKDAVGRALVLLGKKKLSPPNAMYISGVVESLCMGCGLCVDICPYSARYLDEENKVAVVIPILCDGCGSCVAICPNNASYLRDFKGAQLISSLDAVLIGGE